MIAYSIVIPLKDEAQSLPTLHNELAKALKKLNKPYEIIFIDDGSEDNSSKIIAELQKTNNNIKLITFRANFGKSLALSTGFGEATGEVIIAMDADLQDDPMDIPKLIAKLEEGYDLVNGWRKKRADTLSKKISSILFNKGSAFLSGVELHDFNCGLKILRKEVADELSIYGELHRFIPILAAKKKYKVTEIQVNNRLRKYGKSKFGFGRSWRGILDLLTAIFISDFAAKPAHFFGVIGLSLFSAGFLMDAYVTYVKLTTGTTQGKIPLLIAGVFFMLLGVQLLSTGLIAEMVTYYLAQKKKDRPT
ncbi:MAG: glycosyltransferase family 2 protein [Candidatus Levybacteria bacterium]|nr:glycosyltransferase family 2 protein [Candidatus Levybacteria bacterium]